MRWRPLAALVDENCDRCAGEPAARKLPVREVACPGRAVWVVPSLNCFPAGAQMRELLY
jgi:hypothetical protein